MSPLTNEIQLENSEYAPEGWTRVLLTERAVLKLRQFVEGHSSPNPMPSFYRLGIRLWARDHTRRCFTIVGWETMPGEQPMVYVVVFEDPDEALSFKMRWS